MHFNRARCPIEVVASRLELNAFISHQGLSGQVTRNFSEILRATARTNYRKPNDGFLHGHAPTIVAFTQRDRNAYLRLRRVVVNECHLFGAGIQYSGNLITRRRQRRRCNKLTTGHARARRQSVFHSLTPRPVDIEFIVRRNNQNCAP
jgi:hypothetical protein